MNHSRSAEIFAKACDLMPGGVNSPARAFGGVGGQPIVMDRGDGPFLFDVDGNRYVDYIGSWGPLILGHCHPQVVDAIQAALARGTTFGAPTEAENQLAELIIAAVPSVERVRLVSSGTEATMSAIRLARGFTNRKKFIKFSGNYHGHADALLVAAGSSAATLSVPNSLGVTPGAVEDTLVLEYNDVEAISAVFARHGGEIAAVIMEPIVGNMGLVIPTSPFLTAVRKLTSEFGAVLIYDEVMTGFRVAYGGAQTLQGVTPDLTTFGKVVGGGLPLGAYGGRAEIMDCLLPVGQVFQAGTLSGNPLATAAGIATLTVLRDSSPYGQLEHLSQQLADGFRHIAADLEIEHVVQRVGSMLTFFFHNGPVHCWSDAAKCDTGRYSKFFWGMLERGHYLPCSQFEAMFVSAKHTPDLVQQTLNAARQSLVGLT
ncbi:MAG: glutamate-1-semialdehyde 2,1-aminomutase [Planctomycetota bacterium]|nr:glutamate-1-semialdehyde 2,1-aminomutase [Planctomycetota bacterium]MDA1178922.1 glutamate-1-semialdehyde 2,1-aminomutase [Planctomycetota bacterium]